MCYFSATADVLRRLSVAKWIRAGWSPKRFSTRQPMTREAKSAERNASYTTGVLTPMGIAHGGSPSSRETPGPGYYGASTTSPFSPVILSLFSCSCASDDNIVVFSTARQQQ